jgi:hypothetical protein
MEPGRCEQRSDLPDGNHEKLCALRPEARICQCHAPTGKRQHRFFALSGTSSGIVTMPSGAGNLDPKVYFQQSQTTLFDLLDARNISWNVFYYDIPSSLVMPHQRRPQNVANYRKMDGDNDFFKLAAQ